MNNLVNSSISKFPNDFLFGAATSSYQVEGNNKNSNWYLWEKKQNITACGNACDSWNKYEEDIKLLKNYGLQSYRLSLEWSRIFTTSTDIDYTALDHYEKILSSLKKNNIKIFLTLQHHTLPKWINKGWTNPKIIYFFENYTKLIADKFHKYVDAWMPINEPAVNNILGYYKGEFPPGISGNTQSLMKVTRNQLKAHKKAYIILKTIAPDIPVGFVKQMMLFKPYRNSLRDKFLCRTYDHFFNNAYIKHFKHNNFIDTLLFRKSLENYIDFWAVNYYTHAWTSKSFTHDTQFHYDNSTEVTDMGWEWDPEGLVTVITRLWNINNKPIYITENGIATSDDKKRMEYIYQHLNSTLKAIDNGINIKGYFYWSLLDNFEWAHGYAPKFGLTAVDRDTFTRTPKQSGYYLGKIAKSRKLLLPKS